MSKSKALISKDLSSEEIHSELNAIIVESTSRGDAPIHRIRGVFCQVIREKLRHIVSSLKEGRRTPELTGELFTLVMKNRLACESGSATC